MSSSLSLHPHLFPVLVGVGVIQLVLLARPTAAAVATVSKSGEGESSRRKGELDVVMWDTGYPAAAAANMSAGSRNVVRAGTL